MPREVPPRRPPPEQLDQSELLPEPYYRAAQYPNEQASERPYFQAQELIHEADCELSAYRFMLPPPVWLVAVLGLAPSPELDQQIQTVLLDRGGEPTELPPEVVVTLFDRREEQRQNGPWVKKHHRPNRGQKE